MVYIGSQPQNPELKNNPANYHTLSDKEQYYIYGLKVGI